MHKTLLDSLKKRYATKLFDNSKKISPQDLETILESLRLTPTAFGLQLMKVVVVENKDLRKQLLPYSFNQNQIVDASHLLVLCREEKFDDRHIDNYIQNLCDCRNQKFSDLEGFKSMLLNYKVNLTTHEIENWMTNQVYLSLGNLLTSCALLNIDTCPMEGFIPQKYNEILNLSKIGLSSVLVIPIGYSSKNDKYKSVKKVRRSKNNFVIVK